MRNTTARRIRFLLKLPIPTAMTVPQRSAYRRLKRELSRLPHNQRAAYLTLAGLKAAIKKRAPDTKFKTSQTDEDLLELAVELALQDPPF